VKTLQIAGDHGYGGGGYLLTNWCRYLLDRGWRVDVLTAHPGSRLVFSAAGARILGQIPIARRPSVADAARSTIALARLIRTEEYDVVHTYNVAPGVIGRLAARLAGCRAIVHHQAGWAAQSSTGVLEYWVFRVAEYLASAVGTTSVCVGQGVADDACTDRLAPLRKLRVIRNGIDLAPFGVTLARRDRLRHGLGLGRNTRIVGSVGRLARDKDLRTLLLAFDALPETATNDTVLIVVGEGDEAARLHALAASLAASRKILFTGFRADIADILGGMDVFVSTTRREGLSIAILEAMATRLPVIATKITANLELIAHEDTGLLVPVAAVAETAAALQRLLNDAALGRALGDSARARVESEFRLERMLAETYELYRELTTQRC
jgi:glycosyltransferase involved in cell wall biosynthesis